MNEVPHPVHGLQMVMCTCPGPATPTSWSGRMLKAREQRLLDLALWLGLPEDHRGEERKSPQSIQAKDREAKGEMESRWIPAPNSHKATTGASTVPTPPRPRTNSFTIAPNSKQPQCPSPTSSPTDRGAAIGQNCFHSNKEPRVARAQGKCRQPGSSVKWSKCAQTGLLGGLPNSVDLLQIIAL